MVHCIANPLSGGTTQLLVVLHVLSVLGVILFLPPCHIRQGKNDGISILYHCRQMSTSKWSQTTQ